ncbi:MAG: aldose 1-epimerase family protein [Telmatospirillum sp.]|nr:aldose 1-epimerase family protein [Telmatospirillum sp.]
MKKAIFPVGISVLLFSTSVFAKDFVLTDVATNLELASWQITSEELGLTDTSAFTVTKKTLHGGRQEGSTLITVETKDLQVSLIPTRGMDIFAIKSGDLRYGWTSPVDEIVNPAYIALDMRNGLGWLDGFNEMMVRCGFEWTGHPGREKDRLMSLHGRAGNTPASKVVVSVDDAPPHTIHVRGLLKENTFKFSALETWTDMSVTPGVKTVKIHDELTNNSDYDRDYQIIYHSNFGAPLLEEGATVAAPVKEISPFNDYAKKGLTDWRTYPGPTRGYDEMVFNLVPYADKDGRTVAMLRDKAADRGIAVRFDTRQLPVLTLWKNTDTLKQGYVTGIEPGTSYAYPRQIERTQGRVRTLAPNGTQSFDLEYQLLTSPGEIDAVEREILSIASGRPTKIIRQPIAKE